MRRSELRYRTLFEATTDAVLVQRPDGHIVDCNGAACALYGYTREEITNQRVSGLVAKEAAARLAALGDGRATDAISIETVGTRKDGATFAIEVSARPSCINDEPVVVAYVRDITERKQAEQERARLQGQLQQVKKLESLGVLAGGIAHDFNNLLMGVLGNADLALLSLADPSSEREYVKEIAESAQRAAGLCRKMLAYAGRSTFVPTPVQLTQLVESSADLLRSAVSEKTSLDFDLADDLPPIRADATQIRETVMNLVTNACEALNGERGNVLIRTGERYCDADYLRSMYLDEGLSEGRYVSLEVSDTGCGMDRETIERMFEPFFTSKFIGRGLGLGAVLGIVRGHGGAIRVRSAVGHGTTFEVLFPTAN